MKALLITAVLSAFAAQLDTIALDPESRIWVTGTSSVRDFRCEAKKIDASISPGSGSTASLPIANLVETASVAVPVSDLDCSNGTMNGHMRKALKSEQHPKLGWTMSSYTVDAAGQIVLNGRLSIAGTELPIEFRGTAQDASDGRVRVTASREIKMSDWGVKPPSLMLGTMKVHDPVTIGIDVLVKR